MNNNQIIKKVLEFVLKQDPNVSFAGADLHGANLHLASLQYAQFEGANIEGAIIDDNAAGVTHITHEFVEMRNAMIESIQNLNDCK